MTVYVKDAKGFVTPLSLALPKTLSVAKTTSRVHGGWRARNKFAAFGFRSAAAEGYKSDQCEYYIRQTRYR